MEVIACRLPETDNVDDADDADAVRPPPPAETAVTLAHSIKTASLVAASIALLPLSSYVLAFNYACNTLIPPYGLRRKIRSAVRFQPKTILVTGVGTAKGLRIARAFYETGHKVIGADFQPLGIPSCGRFSKALSAYYPLRMPTASGGATPYMRDLVKVVEEEAVQLWISCSELVSAVDDGQARELLERRTSCKTVQVDVDIADKISGHNQFIRHARSIGLPAPEVHAVQSRAAVHQILSKAYGKKKYVMKPAHRNRSSGANLRTILPMRTLSQTYQDVSQIKVSKEEPWILQQYITGEEYHTCSIVANGDVKAFVACLATQLPLNYHSLPTNTGIGKAMLNFTQAFVAKTGSNYTGHLSFKFRVEENATESGISLNVLPVACNPQVNTAMVLFAGTKGSIDLVQAYMKALAPSPDGINGHCRPTYSEYSPGDVSFPHPTKTGVYFSGQDLVLLVLIPFFELLTFKMGFVQFLYECATFLSHLLFWRDAIYEWGDPLPWFWLYHVYLPLHFVSQLWRGRNEIGRMQVHQNHCTIEKSNM